MIGRIGIIICNAYTTFWPIVVSPSEWFYKYFFLICSSRSTTLAWYSTRSADYCAREDSVIQVNCNCNWNGKI